MKLSVDEIALLQAIDTDLYHGDIPPLAKNGQVLAFRAEYSGEDLAGLKVVAESILKKFNTDSLVGAVNLAKMAGII